MWMLFGALAIIAAVLNVVWIFRNKDAKWFRFLSLSLTALTLCAVYILVEKWVLNEDWSALMSVAPGMPKTLFIITIASILINSISLFKKH